MRRTNEHASATRRSEMTGSSFVPVFTQSTNA
ncbi:hypothetical protein BPC006_I3917 [Burkholderia pseudomallei BPC006]|nr:hypothetical protein BPC006_I3917 [Burkholderia pseudomallei BPC006]